MRAVLLVIVILLLIGALPAWNLHSYGYYPSGGLGLILIVVLLLMLV